MAAEAWTFHDDFKLKLGNKEIDLSNDAFEMRLATSTSNIATTSVGDATNVTNQVSGNGYAPFAVTPTWTPSGATSTLDGNDGEFVASGGSIVARFAYLVNTTLTPDLVVAHSLLDDSPADVTVTDGNTLTVQNNASGIGALT